MIRLGLVTQTYEEFVEAIRILEANGFNLPSGTLTDGELELYHNLEGRYTAVFFSEYNKQIAVGESVQIGKLAMSITMENLREMF